MSTGRGRSWRPERTQRKQGARRQQIVVLSTILALLVSGIAYLIFGPAVPALHLVCVAETDFGPDSGGLIRLPTPTAATNVQEFRRLMELIHQKNSSLVAAPGQSLTLADLRQGPGIKPGEKLLLYCAVHARTVPGDAGEDGPVVELLPGNPAASPVKFSEFLRWLGELQAGQIVLLLEPWQTSPGLADGVLTDELFPLLSAEIEAAGIRSLTVICACDAGERSWEFHPAESASDAPAFHGSVFGHFLRLGILEGRAGSADEMFQYVRTEVAEWVRRQLGEQQTVRLLASSRNAAGRELLARASMPPRDQYLKSSEGAGKDESAGGSVELSDGPPAADAAAVAESTPAEKLQLLANRRDAMAADGLVPVLFPVEWRRLQSYLLAAETSLQHQRTAEFSRLHDQYLIPELRRLGDQAGRLVSPEVSPALVGWLSPSAEITDGERAMFRQLLDAAAADRDQGDRLPTELRDSGTARRSFVTWLMNDLSELGRRIDGLPKEEGANRILERRRLIQRLERSGWPAEEFPHQLAAFRDVLAEETAAQHAAMLRPLMQIIGLREQALQYAAGALGSGAPLRSTVWERNRGAVAEILTLLNAAERWLAAGAAGRQLANDRLELAAGQLRMVESQIAGQLQLAQIADSQWHEVFWLIQFLASQQEQTGLAPEERESLSRMAVLAVDGGDPESAFPAGQLDAVDFRREHLSAMFALTRNLQQRPLEDVDVQRLRLLKTFVEDRTLRQMSMGERRRLLEIPLLPQRERLTAGLFTASGVTTTNLPSNGSGSGSLPSRTGIWNSFWSIRLLEATTGAAASGNLWSRWKLMADALTSGDQQTLARVRIQLAWALRGQWEEAFQRRQQRDSSRQLTSVDQAIPMIAADLQQRLVTTENGTYAEVLRQLTGRRPDAVAMTLQTERPEIELGNGDSTELTFSTAGIHRIYVQSNGVRVTDPGVEMERDWQRMELADGKSRISLKLQATGELRQPVPVLLAAVNEQNLPVAMRTVTVHPRSETVWDVEFLRPDGLPMTLIRMGSIDSSVAKRLTLLPSTLDDVTGMDAAVPLQVRLKRIRGVASRISVQLIRSGSGEAVWPAPQVLEVDPASGTVVVPLRPALSADLASAAAAAAVAGTNAAIVDFSEGIRFDITPLDVLQQMTSGIDISIVFSEPDQFVKRPRPVYDHERNLLELRVDRAEILDPSVLVPDKVPVEVHFSPELRRFLLPGSPLAIPNLPAEGDVMRFGFHPDIERADPDAQLEFAISIAGIPNPWRWRLGAADPVLIGDADIRSVRVHLELVNSETVQAVSETPELLIGEGWQQAHLRADLFLYGGRYDQDEWRIQLALRNRDRNQSVSALDQPIGIRRRYRQQVNVSAEEAGAWLFSTRTEPWSQGNLTLRRFGLPDGRYQLVARVEHAGGTGAFENGTGFVVDSTRPVVGEDSVEVPALIPVTQSFRGRVRAEDLESGIEAIRVGLDPAMLQDTLLTGDYRRATGSFEIPPSLYPQLEQREADNKQTVTLHIEVENRAGLKSAVRRPVTFIKKGVPKEKMVQPVQPGSLEVTFNSATPYVVSISGPNGVAETKTDKRVVLFPGLAPGQYTVEWKTEGQGLNKGSSTGTVASGRKTTIIGRK